MANNIFNATEGSGKAMSTETVTTLNGGAVSSRDIQRAALAMVASSGVAKDVLPGRQADADSVGVALSTEDVALLNALLTTGTPITGQSLESGGAGALGWFASIRKKIAAFGTAGTPSTDVLTVQGVSGGTALPVSMPSGTLTAKGGTITTGGTAQTLAASNSSRKYLIVQNQSTGDLYIRFTGTAAADTTSLRLSPGDTYESSAAFVSTQACSVYGATTGQAFYAAEG